MDRFSFFFLLFADICLLCVISLWAIGTARPVPLLVLTSSMLRVENGGFSEEWAILTNPK